MTTTVNVRANAWPVTVTINGKNYSTPLTHTFSNEERGYYISIDEEMTIVENAPPEAARAEPAPGTALEHAE